MLFQLDITNTEEDYLAFNIFGSYESSQAKKILFKNRSIFLVCMIALMAGLVFIIGWTSLSVTYVIAFGLYTILRLLLDKKITTRNIKAHIKTMNRTGKLPFDSSLKYEFYEDKLVEITASSRTEQNYDALEKICIVHDHYIFLYINSMAAYILPLPQVREQLETEAFFNFLAQKCANIEHY